MPEVGITEKEFDDYLNSLTGITPNDIDIVLYSSPSPVTVYNRLFQMKVKALEEWEISGDKFESMVMEEVDKFEEAKRKKIDSLFSQLSQFSQLSPESQNLNLPSFPVECLPVSLKEYSAAVAKNIQVPIDMTAAAALAVAAICVQGKFEVNVKPGWNEPLNLYIVETANPSERKSPVVKAMTYPLYRYTKQYNEEQAVEISEYRTRHNILQAAVNRLTDQASKGKADTEEVLEKERELMELEKHPVKPLRLLADDATPEAITSLMAENNGKMAVISSEGGLFDMAAGQYNDHVNIDVLLKAFTGDSIMIDRKGRPSEQIDRPCLTMLLTVQPSVLNTVMENETFRGRGFLARILYTLPRSMVGQRRFETEPVPHLVREGYEVLLNALLSISVPEFPEQIRLSKPAYLEAKQFAEALEKQLPDELEELQDWAGKYHGQVMRVAGILHCCRYDKDAAKYPIDLETMQAAERIGEYFLSHAKVAFQIMGLLDSKTVKDAKYILKRLETVKDNEISKRGLIRMCMGRFPNAEDMDPGLKELEEWGYIAIETVKTGKRGRPAEIIHLNPEYFKDCTQ